MLKDFKGLYTNYDGKDINPEFLKVSQNIKYNPGYITTQLFQLETENFNVSGKPILIDTVYLDEDKLGVDENFESNYIPNIQKYKLLITREETINYYLYKVYLYYNSQWNEIISAIPFYDHSKTVKKVFIFNTNGIVKIFLPHIPLWLGKINRHYKGGIAYNGFYLDQLIESYTNKEYFENEVQNGRFGINYSTELIYSGKIDSEIGSMTRHHVEIISSSHTIWYYVLSDSDGNAITPIDGQPYFMVDLFREGDKFVLYARKTQYAEDNVFLIYPETGLWLDVGDNKIRIGELLPGPNPTVPIAFTTPNNWIFSEAGTVDDSGFPIEKPEFQLLLTCVLDDNSEFIIDTRSLKARSTTKPAFAIKLTNVVLPENITKRATAFAFYIKFKNQTDYQQIQLVRLTNKKTQSYSIIYLYPLKYTGIYLTQTIGKLFNEYNHNLIINFDDYIEIGGVSFALKGNQVYYPAVGNGQIQKDVFYQTSIIPELYNEQVISLSDINGFLAVHTEKGTKIIVVRNSNYSSFLFFVKDSLGYSIRKKEDVVYAYDGIAILTEKGIYVTNGQSDFLLSEQINDIVESNYENGILLYDEYQKEFYLFIKGKEAFYKFDIKLKVWTEIALKVEGAIERIFNTINGIYILTDRGFSKIVDRNTGSAIMTTHKINLGSPGTLKIFSEFVIDFEGKIIYEGKIYESTERKSELIPIKIMDRILQESFDLTFVLSAGSKLYSVDPNIEIEATLR